MISNPLVGRSKVIPFPTKDPLEAAEQAGLEYVSDSPPASAG